MRRIKKEETFAWLNEWVLSLTKNSEPKLFMAGEKSIVDGMSRYLKYKKLIKTPVSNTFTQPIANSICLSVRALLKEDSKKSFEKTLLEFRLAVEGHLASKNIFQIAKAVVRGKVRKLIVTDELSIFGMIDKKSGGLAIHPTDQDHEDDDILDDLAQMVLSQGGEVIVASRDEIPKGRPILAILEDDGIEIEKSQDVRQYEVLKERFG